MTILALDTAGPVCSVAVMKNGVLAFEARAHNKLTHSINLLPMVEEALRFSGTKREVLTHIAAVIGPGSFTGVRLGVATAQGLARGLGISCIPINALAAMARSVVLRDTLVCPIRDARSSQVYGAAFLNGERILQDAAMKLDDYLQEVSSLASSFYFLGDGALAMGDRIQAFFKEKAQLASPALILPGAAAAAELAMEQMDSAVPPEQLMPAYLRVPQAERLLNEKNKHA